MVFVSLQLCADIEAGIEGGSHDVTQRQLGRIMALRGDRGNKDWEKESSAGYSNNGRREDEASVGGPEEGHATLS